MERMSKIKTTYIYDDETDTAELTELEEVGMSDYKKEFDLACEKIVKLEEEIKKLKTDLGECECSMNFENDEVGYRKRECKKLKEIIRQLLWRFLHRNIANIEYEGEKIELGEGDYDYKIE